MNRTGPDLPPPTAAPPVLVRAVAVLRLIQLLPWPLAMITADAEIGLRHYGLAVGVYAGQAAWTLVLITVGLVGQRISPVVVGVDLGIGVAALVAGGLACLPQDVTSAANPAISPAIGVAVMAAVVLPVRWSGAAVVSLVAGYFAGIGHGIGVSSTLWPVTAANLGQLAGFAVIGSLLARHLRAQAVATARLHHELAKAAAAAELNDRQEMERARQYRMLHDTVLSTLSALARGGIDTADPLVRSRCAADADYLRSIISAGDTSAGNRLNGELAAIGRELAALGLRTQVHCASVPVSLPTDVIQALTLATREALNNVVKHAGVTQAWVTATGDGATLTLAITDRGKGFDPATTGDGTGLRESIGARIDEVGGRMTVDSEPGQGTTVELTWPA